MVPQLNESVNKISVLEWITTGLIIKNKPKGNEQNKLRPVTFLPLMWNCLLV